MTAVILMAADLVKWYTSTDDRSQPLASVDQATGEKAKATLALKAEAHVRHRVKAEAKLLDSTCKTSAVTPMKAARNKYQKIESDLLASVNTLIELLKKDDGDYREEITDTLHDMMISKGLLPSYSPVRELVDELLAIGVERITVLEIEARSAESENLDDTDESTPEEEDLSNKELITTDKRLMEKAAILQSNLTY